MSLCCAYLGAAAGSTFRAGGGSTHAWSRLGQEGSKGLSHVLVIVISGVTTHRSCATLGGVHGLYNGRFSRRRAGVGRHYWRVWG